MDKSKLQMLDQAGWDVECELPFEIRHRDSGSFATGIAAELVMQTIINEWFDMDKAERNPWQ